MNFIFKAIFLVVFLSLGVSLILPKDDTDGKSRSGLSLYTDHKTGLQYIKGGLFGGLTPRLDQNGNHMKDEGDFR